jgi:flagellin
MSINSILTNSSALSALQSLNMTEQNLTITQNQVSSGLAVANASQNAAYWSISQELNSDSGIITASNSALAQSQAIFDTTNSAIQSVLTTINSIQTAITSATNPGADLTDINTTLKSLSGQLLDAVNGASFNGTNLLNGSQTAASLSFVSGFDASATGGAVSTIAFAPSALSGGVTAAATTQTIQQANVTDATFISKLQAMTSNGVATPTYDNNSIVVAGGVVTIASLDANGVETSTAYTGIDNTGTAVGAPASATGFTVATTITTPAGVPTGLLSQTGTTALAGNYNLTTLGSGVSTNVTLANASDMLSAVDVALSQITNYAAVVGATQDRMTAAAALNAALTTNYANGISALVDADMNTASTRLQALQTQQQLGIQSLSIANQDSQNILKLFQG